MLLPIDAVLPELIALLAKSSNAVLIAPPGAGKTTVVAPALSREPWCTGQILLLSLRRLAARAAAERMAELAGETVGQRIGYATRMDTRQSAATRILVLTEGIFRSRIQQNPELAGISAVLFDEVHERSLDSDFGLALALEAQDAFRPDLRLVAMSATLDGSRFGTMMNGPVIESEGRSYPLDIRHIGRRAKARIEDEMATAIRRALVESDGDCLAFLPGVSEIERTAERLGGIGAEVYRLHGRLDPAEQRAALQKVNARKVILATSIAETSLTIDGVRIVVDSGLARRARYDRGAGVTRLVTERASQAAATQRAGRAARQGPGVAYRLWEEAATAGMPRFDPPEIMEADLSPLVLDCAIWGATEPGSLRWLDPPPAAGVSEARARLAELEAIDAGGMATAHGRAIARLPLPPRLAHMLIAAEARGFGALACQLAMLLVERGLGGTDADLEARLARWRSDRSKRAEAARGVSRRWQTAIGTGRDCGGSVAEALALAYPDRVARRRDASGEHWQSVGGRGFRLDPAHPLARSDWLAVADIQGAASGARILSAARIDGSDVEALFADRIENGSHVAFDPATGGVRVETGRRLGAIMLSRGNAAAPDPGAIEAALLGGVRDHGLACFTWPEQTRRFRARARWAGVESLSDERLLNTLDRWLTPMIAGKRRLSDIDGSALHSALINLLEWNERKAIDTLAPDMFHSPAGTEHHIDYEADAGPTVTLRVQAVFGLAEHPVIGPERIPLILSLTSPAGRAIQTTRDLSGFWRGSWTDVAKEMRGAYPKHNWPEDPIMAVPSLRTKKALARRG